ncbi:helicase RepA family protein [Pontixanthobacter gangjinensis]|uniref:AAA family ATPase n=1 Tax=Pontixanthobacter gangjinensis TaxID=1028742 RepID=A0A6I4SNF9_9SPHN|nr:AAA family ATPase [Pontixanthobacter gangjinensis]MXO57179.1 AAA family ATPase [Pontixanthobacter gangjinensis]
MDSLALEREAEAARDWMGGDAVSIHDEGQIRATPYSWPDAASIPPRSWLLGYWYLRGEVTAIVAPGGLGKSTFTIGTALSLASGLDFLKLGQPEKTSRVWVWNLEDAKEELDRQVSACAMHHGTGPADCADRLYLDSGLDTELCTAIEGEHGFEIIEPVYVGLKAEILRRKIDVLIVDPFVSSHAISENDNRMMDKVAKRWKRLASETNSAIVLVHHTKKMGGREAKAEDGRGAVALINAARSTLVVNPMTKEEGERFGITDSTELRHFMRVDDDKPNRAPAQAATWFKKASAQLGNQDAYGRTDSVGAVERWTPPDPFDGISLRHLFDVQQLIAAGEYGANVQAMDWAGNAVAEIIGADLGDKADKARVKSLLSQWTANKAFKIETRPMPGKGRDKPFLIVGEAVEPSMLPTFKSGVG